jgi:hypothetical protein
MAYRKFSDTSCRANMINACWLGRRRRGYFVSRFPEPDSNQAQVGLEEARASDHGLPLCCVLDHAVCPVALMNDDLAATDRAVTILVELAAVELTTGLNATVGSRRILTCRAARAAGTFRAALSNGLLK